MPTIVEDAARRVARGIRRHWVVFAGLVALMFLLNAPTVAAAPAPDTDGEKPAVVALLREGDSLLVKGRSSYPDAIAKYTAAAMKAPRSPKVFFRRADLYFMMRRWEEALTDLNVVLASEPGHKKALEKKAAILVSNADLIGANRLYGRLVKEYNAAGNARKSEEFRGRMHLTHDLGQKWEVVRHRLAEKLSLDDRISANRECASVLQEVIRHFAKDSSSLRLKRAECAVIARYQLAATEELKHVLSRDSHNLVAIALNARLLRQLGSVTGAKGEIRRCLALDPEYPECMALHKSVKRYSKVTDALEKDVAESRWADVIKGVEEALRTEDDPPNLDQLWRWKCTAHHEKRQVEDGLKACKRAIELESGDDDKNPNVADLLLKRADLFMEDDDLDAAGEMIKRAKDANPQFRDIQGAEQKLHGLRNRPKDYYKLLGVDSRADAKAIRRAYKKLALKHHPDKLRGEEMTDKEREIANNRFRDINEAKEVLLDDEKRKRFDAGEDPTKPRDQQQHHHHHGGFPGGGFPGGFPGGGQFHFNFG